jgi:hypothetical protein
MVKNWLIALLSFYLGYSLFFSLIVAPAIFKTAGVEIGGKIVENIFPYYFATSVSLLGISTILLIKTNLKKLAWFLLIATLMAFIQEFYILPKAVELKTTSPGEFKFFHKISVTLNVLEIIIAAIVLGTILFTKDKEEKRKESE